MAEGGEKTIFWEGAVVILIFYLLVFGIGVWSSFKMEGHTELEMMNAGKSLGAIVGTITLVGTWAGGGYITGVAERVYGDGLVMVQVPFGYSLALAIGALLFIKPMRDRDYVTILDLFQELYGFRYGAILIFPILLAEFFWAASVLNSLGTTLKVILHLDMTICVIISAVFACVYTIIGGLVSVSYTDVVQLVLIIIGLLITTPYASHSKYVDVNKKTDFFGKIPEGHIGTYIDDYLTLIFGGIPWQGYFQRVFSIRNTKLAQQMSYWSVLGCTLIAIPSLFMGYYATKATWEDIPEFGRKIEPDEHRMILSLVLRYLTPTWAAVFGLGAVAGAVMASADSAILASSALITRNVYKHVFRPNAADREVVIFLRCMICTVTVFAAAIALSMDSVYYLAFMCSDMVYVAIFPQLAICLYFSKYTNVYGSCISYFYGIIMRILSGEPNFGFAPVIRFPNFDEKHNTQGFPYRTFLMLTSALLFFAVSYITEYLFVKKAWLSPRMDILHGFPDLHVDQQIIARRLSLRVPSQPAPVTSELRQLLQY